MENKKIYNKFTRSEKLKRKKMKGTILDYNIQESSGVISGDDENRYSFVSSEWKSSDFPVVNQIVDFEVDEKNAKAICGTKVEKESFLSKIMESGFTAEIIAGLVLTLMLIAVYFGIEYLLQNQLKKDGTKAFIFISMLCFIGAYFIYNEIINLISRIQISKMDKIDIFSLLAIISAFLIFIHLAVSNIIAVASYEAFIHKYKDVSFMLLFNNHYSDYFSTPSSISILICISIFLGSGYLVMQANRRIKSHLLSSRKTIILNSIISAIVLVILFFILSQNNVNMSNMTPIMVTTLVGGILLVAFKFFNYRKELNIGYILLLSILIIVFIVIVLYVIFSSDIVFHLYSVVPILSIEQTTTFFKVFFIFWLIHNLLIALINSLEKKYINYYEKLSNQGDIKAQFIFGLMYSIGESVEEDKKKAVEWLEKSASQGYAPAQNHIGFLYHDGNGITQDYKKAYEWFEKAANQGDAKAQSNLGLMYYQGDGVKKDDIKAIEWLEKACENGDKDACKKLKKLK